MKTLIHAFLLSLVCVGYAEAQWVAHPTSVTKNLYSIHFASKDIGFATGWDEYGSVVLRTTNGGNSWAQTAFDSQLVFGVHSLSDKHIFVAGYDTRYGCAAILETTDGGSEWQEKFAPECFGFYMLAFPSPTTGFVCGYDGAILKTTDAGASWAATETNTDVVFRSMVFPDTRVGYAVGGQEFNIPDRIYKTTDSGASWTLIKDYLRTRSIGSIYFADSLTGFVAGSDYKAFESIYKTTDGGYSWAEVYSGPNKDIVLQAIDFVDAKHGYAVGSLGRIVETSDGGDSWQAVASGIQETLLSLDASTGGSEIFAAGMNGTLFSHTAPLAVHADASASGSPSVVHTPQGVLFRFASSPANAHLHLYDILGREMRDVTPQSSEYFVSDMSDGSYLWKYDDGAGKTSTGVLIVS